MAGLASCVPADLPFPLGYLLAAVLLLCVCCFSMSMGLQVSLCCWPALSCFPGLILLCFSSANPSSSVSPCPHPVLSSCSPCSHDLWKVPWFSHASYSHCTKGSRDNELGHSPYLTGARREFSSGDSGTASLSVAFTSSVCVCLLFCTLILCNFSFCIFCNAL